MQHVDVKLNKKMITLMTNYLITEASDVQVLKETFPRISEEEIVQALESAGSRNEAAEKLLPPELSSEPTDVICRYVIQKGKREGS